jgi:betaine reductase
VTSDAEEEEAFSMDLRGKKVIAIGERDGVGGPSITACAKSAGASIVYEMTHCFV